MTADATTCGSGQECLGMLRNKVSPNDESVHSQSKDERKREAARSPEPVNQIDILTYHIIVFALCQIFHNRAGHQAVCWPWPWPWSWCSSWCTCLSSGSVIRQGYREVDQLEELFYSKIKVKVDPLHVPVWEFDTSFVASLSSPYRQLCFLLLSQLSSA